LKNLSTKKEEGMRKSLLYVSGLLLALAGTASANDQVVAGCLAEHTIAVSAERVETIGNGCRQILFPPAPQHPNGFHTFGGNQVRAYAQWCAKHYGPVGHLSQIGQACRTFYFPDLKTTTVRIRLPAAESGGLF